MAFFKSGFNSLMSSHRMRMDVVNKATAQENISMGENIVNWSSHRMRMDAVKKNSAEENISKGQNIVSWLAAVGFTGGFIYFLTGRTRMLIADHKAYNVEALHREARKRV